MQPTLTTIVATTCEKKSEPATEQSYYIRVTVAINKRYTKRAEKRRKQT